MSNFDIAKLLGTTLTTIPEIAQAQYCVPCLYISAGTLKDEFSSKMSQTKLQFILYPSKVVAET
jgi:hypothetical protein